MSDNVVVKCERCGSEHTIVRGSSWVCFCAFGGNPAKVKEERKLEEAARRWRELPSESRSYVYSALRALRMAAYGKPEYERWARATTLLYAADSGCLPTVCANCNACAECGAVAPESILDRYERGLSSDHLEGWFFGGDEHSAPYTYCPKHRPGIA